MSLRTIVYNPIGGIARDDTKPIDKERALLLICSGVQAAIPSIGRLYIHISMIDGTSHTYVAGDSDSDVAFN